jgi:multiple sugar transport system permease protein
MIKKRKNIKTKWKIENVIALIIAVFFLFPLYWIVINSFKLDGEIFRNPPTVWPSTITLDAYRDQMSNISRPFLNSTIISISSMIITLLLGVPAGYGLARYKIKGSNVFLLAFLVTQMLPASLILTPLYLTFSNLGLINTYFAPILSTATVSIPFVVLLLRPGFLAIPDELMESAKIDGCTTLGAFFRIVVPVAKSCIVTAACFGFVFSWNDLVFSMTFVTKDAMRPMTAGIYKFMNQYGTQWNRIMAYGTILILPPTILFITMQKHIVSGLVSGSVKG